MVDDDGDEKLLGRDMKMRHWTRGVVSYGQKIVNMYMSQKRVFI